MLQLQVISGSPCTYSEISFENIDSIIMLYFKVMEVYGIHKYFF